MNDKINENVEKIKKSIEKIIEQIQNDKFQNEKHLEKLLKISAELKGLNVK
jgi:Txe/YoeB family toxin of Txe-Axe toxin-antitoxin module